MVKTYYTHRIYCKTEKKYVIKITDNDTPLSTCPNNINHQVESSSASIVDTVSENKVIIEELDTNETINLPKTHFRYEGFCMDVSAGSTNSIIMCKKYDINLLAGYLSSRYDEDMLNIYWAPSASEEFFTLQSDITQGSSTIHCPYYYSYIDLGFTLLIDGFNFGEVIGKDPENKTVITENNADKDYLKGKKVCLRLYFVKSLCTSQGARYEFAKKKIGGALINKNQIVKIDYTNKSQEDRSVCIELEYLY